MQLMTQFSGHSNSRDMGLTAQKTKDVPHNLQNGKSKEDWGHFAVQRTCPAHSQLRESQCQCFLSGTFEFESCMSGIDFLDAVPADH